MGEVPYLVLGHSNHYVLTSWDRAPQDSALHYIYQYSFFKKYFIIFIDKGEGREKEEKKHECVVASHAPPTGSLAHNPGMCPDWESHQ